jgi:hypothetical protein
MFGTFAEQAVDLLKHHKSDEDYLLDLFNTYHTLEKGFSEQRDINKASIDNH